MDVILSDRVSGVSRHDATALSGFHLTVPLQFDLSFILKIV
jgi:hypothetical protein